MAITVHHEASGYSVTNVRWARMKDIEDKIDVLEAMFASGAEELVVTNDSQRFKIRRGADGSVEFSYDGKHFS